MTTLLIESFLAKMEQTARSLSPDPLARSGMVAIQQACRLSDKVLFTESTMRMLTDKLAHFQETVEELKRLVGGTEGFSLAQERLSSFRGGWVQFPKPLTYGQQRVLAMLCFVPGVYMQMGKDALQLYLIGEEAALVDALEQRVPGETDWLYNLALHQCRTCHMGEEGILLPCDGCATTLGIWTRIFGLSSIIAGQYLAEHRYEIRERTVMRHVAREKSGKERRVPVKHLFKVIDANELVIAVPPAPQEGHEQEQESPSQEPRGSWMQGADVVYEEIRTRPFSRTYRHPRYIHMRGQTTQFPEGITRKQPRKKDLLGKRLTKVKASHYEEEEERKEGFV